VPNYSLAPQAQWLALGQYPEPAPVTTATFPLINCIAKPLFWLEAQRWSLEQTNLHQ